MAFGAGELRVLRRALALALHPSSATVQDVQDCHRLAESVDDAARESARFRAFLLADLARYRTALPGTASGYLELLSDALDAEYEPGADDFAALCALRGTPAAAALLDRCRAAGGEHAQSGSAGRAPLPAARTEHAPGSPAVPRTGPPAPPPAAPAVPARRRLLALPGGLAADAPTAPGVHGGAEAALPGAPYGRPGPSAVPATPPRALGWPGQAASSVLSGPAGPREASAGARAESGAESKPEPAAAPEPERTPESEPPPKPAPEPKPEPRRPAGPAAPGRPMPTPAEVFPPKRRPAPPPSGAAPGYRATMPPGRCPEELAAG